MQLDRGEKIGGRYEVVRLLGSGGLAEVYLVRHLELGGLQAIKILSADTEEDRERLLQEGRIQASLRHPNLVSVTDVIRDGARVGLLMEYVEGPTLQELLIERGPLPLSEGLALFDGIVRGVAAAHRHGILHRDLKPANVLLARSPDPATGQELVPRVTDFGIAKLLDDGGSNTLVGTPGYLAPEQLLEPELVGYPADVFALGTILYEILVGVRAFANTQGRIGIYATAQRKPRPLLEVRPDVPKEIVEIVERCLRYEPAERFQDAADLGLELFGHRTETGPLYGVSAPSRPSALARRPGGLRVAVVAGLGAASAVVAAAGGLLGLGLLGLVWWQLGSGDGTEASVVSGAASGGAAAGSAQTVEPGPGGDGAVGLKPDPRVARAGGGGGLPADRGAEPLRGEGRGQPPEGWDPPGAAPRAGGAASGGAASGGAASGGAAPGGAAPGGAAPGGAASGGAAPGGAASGGAASGGAASGGAASGGAASGGAAPGGAASGGAAPGGAAPGGGGTPGPEAAPSHAPSSRELAGRYLGKASGMPFELVLSGPDEDLEGQAVFLSGRSSRTIAIRGGVDVSTGALVLSGTGLTLEGRLQNDVLAGTYTRGSKRLSWEAERTP